MLPANGDTLCPDNEGHIEYKQSDHDLASDGNDGFFVSFIDLRTTTNLVRLTRVNNSAEVVCSRAGVVVSDAGRDQRNAQVCPDGSGGCFVGWSENDANFSLDVYLQHFDANCGQTWTTPLRVTNNPTTDNTLQALVPSADGYCCLFWETGSANQLNIMGTRIGTDGTIAWQDTVCNAPRRQADTYAAEDNNGGAFITWSDNRNQTTGYDIYAQHFNVTGEAQWTDNGVIVCSVDNLQSKPRLIADQDNNVFIIWQDFRSTEHLDLYAQKLSSNGTLLFEPSTGKSIADEAGDQEDCQLLVDPCNGLYATWTDNRGFFKAIYGTHLTTLGEYPDEWWSNSGSDGVICDFFQNKTHSTISHDGNVGHICAWVDWKASGKEPLKNLWANWVTDTTCIDESVSPIGAAMPKEYSLSQNYPNPFNPSTQFEFSIPAQEHVEISLYNTLGQQVMTLVDEVVPAGSYRVQLEASRLSSGVYFCNMKTPNFKQVRKMMLVR
jgi:hypothetical protein